MATTNKWDLEGVSVSEDNIVTADGGFIAGNGATTLYESGKITVNGSFDLDVSTKITLDSATGVVLINNLPTSDPSVTGQLWNDGGILKISG